MSKNITPENFCYWLQGKIEIDGEVEALSKKQVEVIAKHLQQVFNPVTKVKTEDALSTLINKGERPEWPFKPIDMRPVC